MVNMDLIREMVNNPAIPIDVIGVALAFLTEAERNEVQASLTPEEELQPSWQQIDLIMWDLRLDDLSAQIEQFGQEMAAVFRDPNAEPQQAVDLAYLAENEIPLSGLPLEGNGPPDPNGEPQSQPDQQLGPEEVPDPGGEGGAPEWEPPPLDPAQGSEGE